MVKLLEGERVYVLKRRHLIVLQLQIVPLLLILFLIFILTLFFLFKRVDWPQILSENFPEITKLKFNLLLAFLFSLMLPGIWVFIFLIVTQYYLTYWAVTNQRIIYARFISFFNIKYASIHLDKIQDLIVSIKGILPSFFNFGDLMIQTAGEKGQFLLDQIPEPKILKQIIFEAKRDYLEKLKK